MTRNEKPHTTANKKQNYHSKKFLRNYSHVLNRRGLEYQDGCEQSPNLFTWGKWVENLRKITDFVKRQIQKKTHRLRNSTI